MQNEPLNKPHCAVLSEHEIAPQRIDNHEYDLVERRMRSWTRPSLKIVAILPICKAGQYRLVGEEAGCKDQDRNREKEVRKCETGGAQAAGSRHRTRPRQSAPPSVPPSWMSSRSTPSRGGGCGWPDTARNRRDSARRATASHPSATASSRTQPSGRNSAARARRSATATSSRARRRCFPVRGATRRSA